jgi:hypothetical protein
MNARRFASFLAEKQTGQAHATDGSQQNRVAAAPSASL